MAAQYNELNLNRIYWKREGAGKRGALSTTGLSEGGSLGPIGERERDTGMGSDHEFCAMSLALAHSGHSISVPSVMNPFPTSEVVH